MRISQIGGVTVSQESINEPKEKTCPFCPCRFSSETDFDKHMETFGWKQEEHLRKFYEVHRRLEWQNE